MTKMISLLAWSKLHSITYSTAQRMLDRGQIDGASRENGRITVPEDSPPPVRQMVSCAICQKEMPQITGTHLKQHGISHAEYRAQYPEAPTVSAEVSAKISQEITGIVRSEETRKRVSEGRKGIRPKNHPRFVIGSYSPSEATRARMSESHIGKTHSEETKARISAGNLGKVMSAESIEKWKSSYAKYLEENDHPLKGKSQTAEFKARAKVWSAAREAAYTPEKKKKIAQNKSIGLTGIKRTPEQKERYRDARQKFMAENPMTLRETRGELAVKKWLEENDIRYTQQFLIPGIRHVYDFFLPDLNTIIEFDGAHHWAHVWFKTTTRTKAELEQALQDQIERDAYYNMAAGLAGYQIIRVYGYALPGDSYHGTLEEQLRAQEFIA